MESDKLKELVMLLRTLDPSITSWTITLDKAAYFSPADFIPRLKVFLNKKEIGSIDMEVK